MHDPVAIHPVLDARREREERDERRRRIEQRPTLAPHPREPDSALRAILRRQRRRHWRACFLLALLPIPVAIALGFALSVVGFWIAGAWMIAAPIVASLASLPRSRRHLRAAIHEPLRTGTVERIRPNRIEIRHALGAFAWPRSRSPQLADKLEVDMPIAFLADLSCDFILLEPEWLGEIR